MTEPTEHMLLWFDLETTGLDEKNDVILEVGWGLTDAVDIHEWIVEPKSFLIDHPLVIDFGVDPMEATIGSRKVDRYVNEMHQQSGLWKDLYQEATIPLGKAEQAIISVLDSYRKAKFSMAGSGVSQFDMRWIAHHMPDLHGMLTYYSIDLGTYERTDAVLRAQGIRASRGNAAHRAVDDIEFSHRLALAYRAFLLTGTSFDRSDP